MGNPTIYKLCPELEAFYPQNHLVCLKPKVLLKNTKQSYLPSRNTDTDVENKHMDTKGAEWGGMNWEIGIDVYTLLELTCIHR